MYSVLFNLVLFKKWSSFIKGLLKVVPRVKKIVSVSGKETRSILA